tara:strand:- start:130 stop:249 length:120 start_codon:yes stop_codon:yes gene_type:complete
MKLLALKLDIYFPDQNVDLLNLRPLVIMIHGGSFIHKEN